MLDSFLSGAHGFGAFVVLLVVLVAVHELGHFLVAKWCGVKVLTFSIGFGPPIFEFKKGETVYRLAMIPLGGFVRMAGEMPHDEVTPEEATRSFLNQPPGKRAAIVAAGPAFNLVFPILLYFFYYVGAHQVTAPRVGWVEPEFPAAKAGIRPGDRIVAINGERVNAFEEIAKHLASRSDVATPVTVEREGKELVLTLTPASRLDANPFEKTRRGVIGVSAAARAPIIGVPPESSAFEAGLRTFDRLAKINGQPVTDELELERILSAAPEGPLELTVLRETPGEIGVAAISVPSAVTLTVPKQPGRGYAALGVESAELYVWSVKPQGAADKAGLKTGDRLVSIDGQRLSSWMAFSIALSKKEKTPFELQYRSGTESKTVSLAQYEVEYDDDLKNPQKMLELGVRPRPAYLGAADPLGQVPPPLTATVTHDPLQALKLSLQVVPGVIAMTAMGIGKLFTGDVPLAQVGGPGTLYQLAARSADEGARAFLGLMALVSVNLGLVNLLPIPVLDGFALLAAGWEAVRRKSIPERAHEIANLVGFAFLITFMVFVALRNDIQRFLR